MKKGIGLFTLIIFLSISFISYAQWGGFSLKKYQENQNADIEEAQEAVNQQMRELERDMDSRMVPPPPGDPEFIAQIGAFADSVSYQMAFGFSPNTTDDYDSGIDQYAPPAPPPPAFDAALTWNGERYYTQIVHGSADDLVQHEWGLQLQYPTSNSITLVWNNEKIRN